MSEKSSQQLYAEYTEAKAREAVREAFAKHREAVLEAEKSTQEKPVSTQAENEKQNCKEEAEIQQLTALENAKRELEEVKALHEKQLEAVKAMYEKEKEEMQEQKNARRLFAANPTRRWSLLKRMKFTYATTRIPFGNKNRFIYTAFFLILLKRAEF